MSEEINISAKVPEVYTIKNYLQGLSSLLSEKALQAVLAKRRLAANLDFSALSERDVDLAEAEALRYLYMNATTTTSTIKDVDGVWQHSEGGATISSSDLSKWKSEYIRLRKKWGESVELNASSTIKVNPQGMRVWHRH
jgi:hypothetical protein